MIVVLQPKSRRFGRFGSKQMARCSSPWKRRSIRRFLRDKPCWWGMQSLWIVFLVPPFFSRFKLSRWLLPVVWCVSFPSYGIIYRTEDLTICCWWDYYEIWNIRKEQYIINQWVSRMKHICFSLVSRDYYHHTLFCSFQRLRPF